MSALTMASALAAAMTWAGASLLAHGPAGKLGALTFTRVQLVAAALVLVAMVTIRGAWATVTWSHWPELTISGLVGVLLCNLALIACLRRGGPRRCLLLLAMNAPIAALLGYVLRDETASLQSLAGGAAIVAGVVLAIWYGRKRDATSDGLKGSPASVLLLGLAAAACHAIGLVAIKPAMLAGTDPVAASALRIAGSAAVISLIALWPAKIFRSETPLTPRLVVQTVTPGILGYVVAT
ncbi:MAG TPA: EamA family transporter, partial [Alphaproteobacteria bacterium]|nr:EamA family transporter [Alphaproteobacteria bacterium]